MLIALSPAGLPRVDAIRVDFGVFVFAFGVSVVVGMVVGLLPAIRAFGGDLHDGIQQGSRSTAGRHQRTRRGLVVAELALAFVLLVGAGLLFRSLQHLFGVSPGFDPANVLTMQVQVAGTQFRRRVDASLLQGCARRGRTRATRHECGFTSQLPISGDNDLYGVHFYSETPGTARESDGALRYAVSSGYFESLRIPLVQGRLLQESDTGSAPKAVVVNEIVRKTTAARAGSSRQAPAHRT